MAAEKRHTGMAGMPCLHVSFFLQFFHCPIFGLIDSFQLVGSTNGAFSTCHGQSVRLHDYRVGSV